jgi:hypothetical protein
LRLDPLERRGLRKLLRQGGMPRLFWPGVIAHVESLCTAYALRSWAAEGSAKGRVLMVKAMALPAGPPPKRRVAMLGAKR